MVKCIKEIAGLNKRFILDEVYQVLDQDSDGLMIYDGKEVKFYTYKDVLECFRQLSTKESSELLVNAAKPMIDYLKKFYNPMTTAVITESFVKIVVDEVGTPVEIID